MTLSLVVIAAFVVSLTLSLLVRRAATKRGAVVPPRSDRWHHETTPTFGGIAMAGATLVVSAAALALQGELAPWHQLLAVMTASFVLFVLGLLDDRLQLTALTKLVATLVVGSFLLYGLVVVSGAAVPWWQTIVLVVWYAGVVHAFNLLDNMDGLAGGVTIVAIVGLVATFDWALEPALVLVLMAVAGAVGGFLVWNVRPARLFMGDCGSLLLGSVVAGASLVVLVRPGAAFVFDGFVLGLVLVVPLLDTSFVLVLRRLAGREATRGGTDHVSHRLVSLGLTERMAVAALYAVAIAGSVTAWLFHSNGLARMPLAALFVVAVSLFGVYLARVPAYDGEDFRALQKTTFAPFLRDLTFRWHAIEMLLDVVVISAVLYGSYRIRFEGEALENFLPTFTASLPVILGCKLLALYVSGVYDRMWWSFGLRDLFAIVRGVLLGSVASIFAAAYFYRFERFSRGVFLIDAVLLTMAIVTVRGSFRLMGEAATMRNGRAKRALIYGAGKGGQLLVREMRANREWNLMPVAFLDDDPAKRRRRLMGVAVRGGVESIESVLARDRIDEVVFSTASVDSERDARVREICGIRGIRVRRFRLEITE